MRRHSRALRVSVLLFLCALVSCQSSEPYVAPPVDEPSIASEMDITNTAAYPEKSYVVRSGDAPRGIAAKLGLEYDLLARANGFTDQTVLKPGDTIIVPRVAQRTNDLPGRGPTRLAGDRTAAAAGQTEVPVSKDSAGRLRAVSGGTVTAVYRGYPGLGDVVIIENDVERIVYSGGFTPSVAKGDKVSAGNQIGAAGRQGSVKAARFPK